MFTSEVKKLSDRIAGLERREATIQQVQQLEQNGNIVGGKIFFSSIVDLNRIKNNVFLGTVIIGIHGDVSLTNTSRVAACISGCTLVDCVVEGNSFLKDCAMMQGVYVGPGCVLISNGPITSQPQALYGMGSEVVLCEETGTRSILSHPDFCSLETVAAAIESRKSRSLFNEQILEDIECGVGKFNLKFMATVFTSDVSLLHTSSVDSCWFSSGVSVCSGQVSKSIFFSQSKVSNAIVHSSIVGRNVSIDGYAVVEHSILCDYSKVSVHGKVVHSLLGSYSGVESGECVSSLIGPFVGFHHQSLCIATYWPAGRGNMGYGANVGSNHSGKAPDCELLAGEGMFFGLATVVKFPCNFSKAVYSLIASGVSCLPQRLEMPFSLINTGSLPSQYPGLNEISPGWILSDNMFTLIRNEEKFATRQDKQDARVVYEHQVFRPDTMRLVTAARDKLTGVKSRGNDAIYTEADIDGIGKNYLREPARQRAIDTYSFILRWYGLRGLYRRISLKGVEQVGSEIEAWPAQGTGDSEWEHCLEVLVKERMNLRETKSLLEEFAKLDFLISSNCVSSKTKDDVRGAKIIGPSYADLHPPASEHAVCVKVKRRSAEIESNVARIVSRL